MKRIGFLAAVMLLSAAPAFGQTAAVQNSSVTVPSDPTASGIAAVNAACELLRGQGNDAAVSYFTDALSQTRNAAVERAIRFQLASLYKESNRPDKALEVLKDLIASIPPQPAPSLVQIVPAETTGSTTAAPPQQ